jgi:tetratricopeptide (TPR) repeat protein
MKELIYPQGVIIMKKALLIGLVIMIVLSACSANRQKLSPQGNLYLKSANVYYQQRDNETSLLKSLSLYEKVLENNPNHVLALKRSADLNYYFALPIEPKKDVKEGQAVFSNMENAVKAIDYFKITYAKYDAVLTVMNTFEKLSEAERAIKRDATKKKESSWVKMLKISQLLIETKKYDDASGTLEYIAKLDPSKQEPLRMMVILFQETKDSQKFEYYLNKVLDVSPGDVEMLQLLGVHYYNNKEYAKAAANFNEVMKLKPLDIDNMINLTDSYLELGDSLSAMTVNSKILKIEPDNVTALITAKDISKKLGNQADEIAYMKRIIDIEPTAANLKAYLYMMVIYNNYEDVLDYAEQWYALDNTNKEAVQMCYIIAQKINRKDLMTKYNDIYQALPK